MAMPSNRAVRLGLVASLLTVAACGQKPASLSITPGKLTLYGTKKTAGLTTTVLDKKGNVMQGLDPQWESSKPKVASVESGVVRALGPGKTAITARLDKPPLSATCNVEVIDVASILLSPTRMTFAAAKGAKLPLKPEVRDSAGKVVPLEPQWTSSDPKVATVDPAGVVTSVSEGKATITAQLGDYGASTELRVLFREIDTFSASPLTMLLKVGESQRITPQAKDAAGGNIEDPAAVWTSSDPKTASCVNGAVTGIAKGTATVKVQCGTHMAEVSVLVN